MMPSLLNQPLRMIQWGLAVLWIYQGLIPKILFPAVDELGIWQLQGFSEAAALWLMRCSGTVEMIFGGLFLICTQTKWLHLLNMAGMVALSLLIVVLKPSYFIQAFNPFVMNLAMAMLSIIALQLLKLKKHHHEK